MSRQKMEPLENQTITNWSKTYTCKPKYYFKPSNIEELKEAMTFARDHKLKVRAVGASCSPSDIGFTGGVLISMKNINKVISMNSNSGLVEVEAGILISALNETLAMNGLSLSVQGSISCISLVGAMCTGVHGTGAKYGCVSTFAREIKLLKADGEIVLLKKEDEDNSEFRAACVSLGSLGIIISVKIQCDKAFNIHQVRYGETRKEMMDKLDYYIDQSEHFRALWYPQVDGCVVFNSKRTKEKEMNTVSNWLRDILLSFHLVQFLFFLSTFLPNLLLKPLCWFCFNILEKPRRECINRSDKLFNFDCLFQQYVTEWAFPREHTADVIEELSAWFKSSKFPNHFPIEIRFASKDDLMLSACTGVDSCYINLLQFRPYGKFVEFQPLWDAFQAIMMKYNGRTHWAKDHSLTNADFAKMYPEWSEFCAIRRRYDPTCVFVNRNLKQVFGDDL